MKFKLLLAFSFSGIAVISLAQVIYLGSVSFSIGSDSSVCAWGINCGQTLGDSAFNDENSPTPRLIPELFGIKSIVNSECHALALVNENNLITWGTNYMGDLGVGSDDYTEYPITGLDLDSITQIAAGEYSSMAVKSNGHVYAWGSNYHGQLGMGTSSDSYNTPTEIPSINNVAMVAVGNLHSLFLKEDSTVWACGDNSYGSLGDGTTISKSLPVKVYGLSNIIKIVAGFEYSVALRNDGTVWAWGDNTYGQCGDSLIVPITVPTQITGLNEIRDISCGQSHCLFLDSNGSVWSIGYNGSGQLGDGTSISRSSPIFVSGINNIYQISAGNYYSGAISYKGQVWLWGLNDDGEIGNDNLGYNAYLPVNISLCNSATEISHTTPREGGFLIYPNPCYNEIKIYNMPFEKSDIYIYNDLGILIFELHNVNNNNLTYSIKTDNLNTGYYFIRITNNQNNFTGSFYKL